MNIGKALKAQRIAAGITQKKIQKATAIPQQTVSSWENDVNIPSIENCIILADFYGISIDELVGHEIKKNW